MVEYTRVPMKKYRVDLEYDPETRDKTRMTVGAYEGNVIMGEFFIRTKGGGNRVSVGGLKRAGFYDSPEEALQSLIEYHRRRLVVSTAVVANAEALLREYKGK